MVVQAVTTTDLKTYRKETKQIRQVYGDGEGRGGGSSLFKQVIIKPDVVRYVTN